MVRRAESRAFCFSRWGTGAYSIASGQALADSQVVALDTTAKCVKTSKGNEFPYDILVLATGSIADLPPYMSAQRAKEIKGESAE